MIELVDVSKTYEGGVQALARTDLSIERGKVTVLLGPSGAGKSTLLRCMNLLVKPTTGSVRVDGTASLDSRRELRRHRRRTGMVFQHHQLIPRLSALRNVLLGRVGYHSFWQSILPSSRGDQRIALEALERVGLLDKALTRVDNLSGGMQQRVGIARALAQQPDLILADEPVASLDPNSARLVMELLRRVCQESGITLVASLHQVDLALEHADRIVGLAHGEIVYDGPAAGVTDEDLLVIYGGVPADEQADALPLSAQTVSLPTSAD